MPDLTHTWASWCSSWPRPRPPRARRCPCRPRCWPSPAPGRGGFCWAAGGRSRGSRLFLARLIAWVGKKEGKGWSDFDPCWPGMEEVGGGVFVSSRRRTTGVRGSPRWSTEKDLFFYFLRRTRSVACWTLHVARPSYLGRSPLFFF